MMMHAEVTQLVCSGALRGKTQTYALLEERAPNARRLTRDEALAELTRRYFTSHGPATVKDFRVWCSLPAADAKRGLDLVGSELEPETRGDLTYWSSPRERSRPVVVDPSPTVHLLQGYDEYIMGYTETKSLIDLDGTAGYSPTDRAIYVGVMLLDGQFAGNWKRTIGREEVEIHVQLTRAFDDAAIAALHAAADRHGAFLGRPAVVVVD
jgi:DNA glycosylase AlkZ-like